MEYRKHIAAQRVTAETVVGTKCYFPIARVVLRVRLDDNVDGPGSISTTSDDFF